MTVLLLIVNSLTELVGVYLSHPFLKKHNLLRHQMKMTVAKNQDATLISSHMAGAYMTFVVNN